MKNNDVLILGGGIAGMQSALLLAEKDHHVYVMDSAPAIGGFFPLLDRQFPTNSCGVCFMSPKPPAFCPIYESEFHENIEILTNCSITGLEGSAGDFRATVVQKPRFVDMEKCTLCNECTEVCPVQVDSKMSAGLEKRKAIYLPFAQAIPRSFVIDESACTKCGECVTVCSSKAINLEEEPVEKTLNIGAVILGFGFEPFQAELRGEYGLGRYANVLSSIQYERMLSLSGPTQGIPLQMSSGKKAAKVAFIQCVGSRDISCNQEYCSNICCMYATKQAMLSKDRTPDINAAVFYMDIRTMGKNYERYYEKAKNEYGIRYIRSAVSTVRELKRSNRLVIAYGTESGELKEEEFDLVVLSVGFTPPEDITGIARTLGIELNPYGFCATEEFLTTNTSIPGIFVAGAFREPRDIPETVVEASSAAADVSALLEDFNKRETTDVSEESSTVVSDGDLRIGVFFCDSKRMLAEKLHMSDLDTGLKKNTSIVTIDTVDVSSLIKGAEAIQEKIIAEKINRVVLTGYKGVALHRKLRDMLRGKGLMDIRLECINIGEQCADVHTDDVLKATKKALVLVKAGIKKLKYASSPNVGKKKLHSRVLVVGGGVSGLASSLSLAEQGMPVTLVEKDEELGGLARSAYYTLKGSDIQHLVTDLVSRVEKNAAIEVLKKAELKKLSGVWGNFRSQVVCGGENSEIEHGAVIVATGGREVVPDEYLYGRNEYVVTQRAFEGLLVNGDERAIHAREIVMIQCVGSRDQDRPYCSRVCCNHAVKNALKVKELNPDATIYILNRDVRTYGFYEKKYLEARDKGILFIRYDVSEKPAVTEKEGVLEVSFFDGVTGEKRHTNPDYVVLSVGIEPNDNRELAEIAGLERNADGFFVEANPKSAPLDSVDHGKYFCGLCHSPNHIEDAICQGKAAAARASALLWKGVAEYSENQAYVNERRCCGCGLCVSACPYEARIIDTIKNKAMVIEELCKGCGTCTIACPNSASQQYNFNKSTMLDVLNEVLD